MEKFLRGAGFESCQVKDTAGLYCILIAGYESGHNNTGRLLALVHAVTTHLNGVEVPRFDRPGAIFLKDRGIAGLHLCSALYRAFHGDRS